MIDFSTLTDPELDFSGKGITEIGDISTAKNLYNLNLSNNNISMLPPLINPKLTWLNLSSNKIITFQPNPVGLLNLLVLNLGHNQINQIPTLPLPKLCALILNNNEIKSSENIKTYPTLTTLILSHNKIQSLPNLSLLKDLKKVSLSHNSISIFPDFSNCEKLCQLKLVDNKIKCIPEPHIQNLKSIEILDLGNNCINDFESIESLRVLKTISNLNLKGNGVCLIKNYRDTLIEWFPNLRVIDGERFDQGFLNRKKKREVMEYKKKIKGKNESIKMGEPFKFDEMNENKRKKIKMDESKRIQPLLNQEMGESLNVSNEQVDRINSKNPFDLISKEKKGGNDSNHKKQDKQDDLNLIENIEPLSTISGVVKVIKSQKSLHSFNPKLIQIESQQQIDSWDD